MFYYYFGENSFDSFKSLEKVQVRYKEMGIFGPFDEFPAIDKFIKKGYNVVFAHVSKYNKDEPYGIADVCIEDIDSNINFYEFFSSYLKETVYAIQMKLEYNTKWNNSIYLDPKIDLVIRVNPALEEFYHCEPDEYTEEKYQFIVNAFVKFVSDFADFVDDLTVKEG